MMSTREFIQHVLMNGELDDPIRIEVQIPVNNERRYLTFEPAHVTHIGDGCGTNETLIECKPIEEE